MVLIPGWLVKLKKKSILKNKLLEPIVGVVFMLMATASDGDSDEDSDGEDDYYTENENANPRTTATQTMDLLALHVPPEKLIPPLLQYIEPVNSFCKILFSFSTMFANNVVQ